MLFHIFSLFSYKDSRRARFYMLLRLYIYYRIQWGTKISQESLWTRKR